MELVLIMTEQNKTDFNEVSTVTQESKGIEKAKVRVRKDREESKQGKTGRQVRQQGQEEMSDSTGGGKSDTAERKDRK
jgi:hypothetical protein